MDDNRHPVKVWTDGSCYPNPGGHGGWSFVARWKGKQETRVGYVPSTTNNEMELMGVFHALRFIRPTGRPLHLFTDSKYVVRCVNEWVNNWRRFGWINSQGQPVKNRELIDDIRKLMDHHRSHNGNNTHVQWTPGHVGNRYNELADSLAGIARIDKLTDWNEIKDSKIQLR